MSLVFGRINSNTCIENQEFPTIFFDKEFEEIESKPGKPIPMSDRKFQLVSAQKPLQYGTQRHSF
ncbi:hypothetical protein CCP2SC5_1060009 [Azospirillaceae bacterium]